MDFLVVATLQLNGVPDKVEVREILRSNGFVLEDLTSNHMRVRGSFLKLKSVTASLEMLQKSPAKVGVAATPSPGPKMSSGAISKHHTHISDAKRGLLESQNQRASPASASFSSSLLRGSSSLEDFPGTPDQTGAARTGRVCSVVDPDVFDYAKGLLKKEMETILLSHGVRMSVNAVDDHYSIILWGKNANVCMNKLRTLLDNLHKSLRTQEVPLKDLTPGGRRLAARIQESKNIYRSVLVQKRNSSLHLIGPSGESYELQQTLLGRTVDRSQRRGRRPDRQPTRRSSSLPPSSQKRVDGAGGGGSSPARFQGTGQEAAEARRRLGGGGGANMKEVDRQRWTLNS